MIERRDFLKLSANVMVGGMVMNQLRLPGFSSDVTKKPNIIFILADDLGYGDLGCYGQEQIQTLFLDQMAEEGIRFTSCYAGSTVCAPSRCVLMTGLHTGHCHIRGNDIVPLRQNDLTVAELLKQAGYTTGLMGKWGLGDSWTEGVPNKKGFDEFYGYLNHSHAHDYYPDHLVNNQMVDPLVGNLGGRKGEYTHDLITIKAHDFIERNQHRPFFLYLAYTIPHANNERGALGDGIGMEVPDLAPYEDKDWPINEKGKAAMITRMDRDIGKLFDLLKKLGLDENTIVFFTSDNGTHREGNTNPEFFKSSGPLRGIKRDLYEGGIRVPMIVRWPGKIQPGTSDYPWAFWDFLPTAGDLAGISVPEGLDGQSVLPTLLGDQQEQHEFFYWEFHESGFKQAVRYGDWKAVRLGTQQPLELYNLKLDLEEKNNVAEENPEIVNKILDYLKIARVDNPYFPIREKI